MVIHLEVDPKQCSYQFLYEIALFETNSENLAEIFDTISTCELRQSDCSEWESTIFDVDCTVLGVKQALALNKNTPVKVLRELAKDSNEMLRATIAVSTTFDEVINILVNDAHIYIAKDLLENSALKKRYFNAIVRNFVNGYYDFEADFNKEKHISPRQFAKFLTQHKYATSQQIATIKNYISAS